MVVSFASVCDIFFKWKRMNFHFAYGFLIFFAFSNGFYFGMLKNLRSNDYTQYSGQIYKWKFINYDKNFQCWLSDLVWREDVKYLVVFFTLFIPEIIMIYCDDDCIHRKLASEQNRVLTKVKISVFWKRYIFFSIWF